MPVTGSATETGVTFSRSRILTSSSGLLQRIWDPDEFLSPHGIRSLSQYHRQHPFQFGDRSLGYEPGEAEVKLKGGNSNWRGPVWFPTSYLLIHSFVRFDQALGADSSVSTRGSQGRPITPTRDGGRSCRPDDLDFHA